MHCAFWPEWGWIGSSVINSKRSCLERGMETLVIAVCMLSCDLSSSELCGATALWLSVFLPNFFFYPNLSFQWGGGEKSHLWQQEPFSNDSEIIKTGFPPDKLHQ